MNLINKQIKVMAIFYTDGKIEPIKFRLDDKVIYIQKIIDTKIDNSLCPNRIFICQHNGNLYELRYEPNTCMWYLSKK